MAILIYLLCTVVSAGIAWMLWAHQRRTQSRLLKWSALCFVGLTINNILLTTDKLIFPQYDLALLRQLTALASLGLLLYGLIYEDE